MDFNSKEQKAIYDKVVEATREIYRLARLLASKPSKSEERSFIHRKHNLIEEVEALISKVYHLDFCEVAQ